MLDTHKAPWNNRFEKDNEPFAMDESKQNWTTKIPKLVVKVNQRLKCVPRGAARFLKTNFVLVKYGIRKALLRRCRYHGQLKTSGLLFTTTDHRSAKQWVFHDESWVRVIHRREHRRIVAAGLRLSVVDNFQGPADELSFAEDGTIYFKGRAKTSDEWIYLYLDPEQYAWDNYSWQFRMRRDTAFKEFQLGFRYQDFYNRYRYRFENDHIYFDKVVRARFFNAFGAVPFRMTLGAWYDVRIDVFKNNFRCYVDGVLMLDDYDFQNCFHIGSIAIILWEPNGITDIRAAVGPISVHNLVSCDAHE